MSDGITCKVEGLSELENAMLERAPEEARKASRKALGEAGDFMVEALSSEYRAKHRITGWLAAHILKKVSASVKKDEGSVEVGPSRSAWYARLVEFGSKHNQPPDPVIRRTFESKWQQMLDIFAARLRKELGL